MELVNATLMSKRVATCSSPAASIAPGPSPRRCFAGASGRARRGAARQYGDELSWKGIHDAAIAKGGWPELGGKAEWGYFKLVVPTRARTWAACWRWWPPPRVPSKNAHRSGRRDRPAFPGLAQRVDGRRDRFLQPGAYSVENLALFGYSMGDGGQLLETTCW